MWHRHPNPLVQPWSCSHHPHPEAPQEPGPGPVVSRQDTPATRRHRGADARLWVPPGTIREDVPSPGKWQGPRSSAPGLGGNVYHVAATAPAGPDAPPDPTPLMHASQQVQVCLRRRPAGAGASQTPPTAPDHEQDALLDGADQPRETLMSPGIPHRKETRAGCRPRNAVFPLH